MALSRSEIKTIQKKIIDLYGNNESDEIIELLDALENAALLSVLDSKMNDEQYKHYKNCGLFLMDQGKFENYSERNYKLFKLL